MASSSTIRAGQAFVELFAKDNITKTLQRTSKAFKEWGSKIMAAGLAIKLPLEASQVVFGNMAAELNDVAQRLGVSAEELSALKAVVEDAGGDFMGLERSLRTFQMTLGKARDGNETAIEDLKLLGLTSDDIAQSNGRLIETFKKGADGIAAMTDADHQAIAAQMLFGRTGNRLLPALKQGAGAVEDLENEARRLGTTMSEEDVKAGTEFHVTMGQIWRQVKYLTAAIGSALTPGMMELLPHVQQAVADFIGLVKANKQLIFIVSVSASGVIVLTGALIGLGYAFNLAAVGAGVFGAALTVIEFLLSPIGLAVLAAVGAIALLGAAWAATAGKMTVADTAADFANLGARIEETFGGIQDALMAHNWGLALRVGGLELRAEWNRILKALQTGWSDTVDFFGSGWDSAMTLINRHLVRFATEHLKLWEDVKAGVINAIDDMALALKQFIALAHAMWRAKNPFANHDLIKENLEKDLVRIEQERGPRRDAGPEKARLDKEADKFDAKMGKKLTDRDQARADDRQKMRDSWDKDIGLLDEERKRLQDLAGAEAAAAAEEKRMKQVERDYAEAQKAAARPEAVNPAQAIIDAVKGMFGSQNIKQAMAYGDRVQDRIAESTKRTADGIERLNRNAGGLNFED